MNRLSEELAIWDARRLLRLDRSPPTTADSKERLQQMKQLATAMDSALKIPFTNYRVGLDSLLGLIPGIGDVATAAVAAVIVYEAMQMGVRKRVVLRMLANIGLDTILGSIPVLGDIFDVAYKANSRNIELLERELAKP